MSDQETHQNLKKLSRCEIYSIRGAILLRCVRKGAASQNYLLVEETRNLSAPALPTWTERIEEGLLGELLKQGGLYCPLFSFKKIH